MVISQTGIPWGAKDLLAVKEYKTTWGAIPYKDQVIDADVTVVRRLEEAGAVLVGKLTLGALAWGDVWFAGKTRNPWAYPHSYLSTATSCVSDLYFIMFSIIFSLFILCSFFCFTLTINRKQKHIRKARTRFTYTIYERKK